MFRRPSAADVAEAAAELGFHLSEQEAILFRQHVVDELATLDTFVQSQMADEPGPPRFPGPREPGYRPSEADDPLGAWLWRCTIPGAGEGPLAAKRVGIKDHIAVAGIPLTFGSFAMDGFIPDFDATVVRRTLEAGGTVVGKNTLNGLVGGYGFGGGIGDYVTPRNPHDPEHLPGGSSSGSAVAVVAGDADIAFGGDQGGSIRVPASWCGAVGLKPTFGLVSHFGAGFGWDQSLDHVGPLARTADDAARALEAVAGFDGGLDPRQGREVPDRMDVRGRLEAGVSGIRLGVLEEGFVGADPQVSDLVRSAVDLLAQEGATVSTVSVPSHLQVRGPATALVAEGSRALFETGFLGAFAKTYYPPSLVDAIDRLWSRDADLLAPLTKASYLVATFSRQSYHGRCYARAHNLRPLYVRAYDSVLTEVDVLVMPTTLMTAPRRSPVGDYLTDVANAIELLSKPVVQNTLPFNYTGHPALAVPCGRAGGLPVSMQLVGRAYEDPLLLRVATAFERAEKGAPMAAVGQASAAAGKGTGRSG